MQELLRTGVNMGQATAITEAFAASFESIAMHLSNQERLIVGQDCYHCWQARDNFEGKTNVVKCGCGLLTKTSMLSEGESVNPLQNGDVNSSLILDAALSKRESIKTSIQTFLTMLQIDWIMSK